MSPKSKPQGSDQVVAILDARDSQARKQVKDTDTAAILAAAQNANSVPQLRQAVDDLAQLVEKLVEAIGLK